VYNHGCQLFEKSQITDHKTAASLLLGLCCRFFHANQRFFKNLNILIYFWLPTWTMYIKSSNSYIKK
jgi:hypothetical protein